MFIHWGPYAEHGRGEQVLFREYLDAREYEARAGRWNPGAFDARALAALAAGAGMKYAVFTARHHDGYCLWDSALTDYTSVRLRPGRDFVREYVEAFRAAGLRVGIYYSLADWRIPAYWNGPARDPEGWNLFRDYVHGQVEELAGKYGKIDVFWFDGAWPHSAEIWQSKELVQKIRTLQPEVLINNRLDAAAQTGQEEAAGISHTLGDFGTPERKIVAEADRLWESCQVSTWRLWGYARGEHYHGGADLLDLLCNCAAQGGNLLLNVAPDGEGLVPDPVKAALGDVGRWLRTHGEAIYRTRRGDLAEFTTYGYQTRRDNTIYLIYRFWPRAASARVPGIHAPDAGATLLGGTHPLPLRVEQTETGLVLHGLPVEPPGELFPVIRLDCESPPVVLPWAVDRLWNGDPSRMAFWAEKRGTSVAACR